MIEKNNLIIISTAYLHPLEAQKIDEYAYVGNNIYSLVSTAPEMRDLYYGGGLVCLCDLLKELKEKHNVDYVLFDPDVVANANEFREYEW